MEKISIIICDDHPLIRKGMISVIENVTSFELIGECGDGLTAQKIIKEQKPDVAILDISLPKQSGLQVARSIYEEKLPMRTIIVTMYDDEEYFYEALENGVMGYLLKENSIDLLVPCIKAVVTGKNYITPLLTDYLINYTQKSYLNKYQNSEISKLSCIERKVLSLLAENKTNKEIAQKLYLSDCTIKNHRQHIIKKINLNGNMTLKQFAVNNKIYLEGF